ncbi:hypothetical protein MNBD_GAMMA11-1245 [hydrothermal vent metagenome]|uniref:Uncharacterized protein n=1 Tax=hydrothermal vent metagenome TaxID=652676 RepID=A0A3B0WQH8_9ZZZZ
MNEQRVNQAVEAICNTGCNSVNAVIHTLESGHSVKGIEDFSQTETMILINELRSIMAVYECRKG